MANKFGFDITAGNNAADSLRKVRDWMNKMDNVFNEYDGSMGSGTVEKALDDFFKESSDSREKLDKLLEQAAGRLGGLAKDVDKTDRGYTEGQSKGAQKDGGAEPKAPEVGRGRAK